MSIDIIKCENGWVVREINVNRAVNKTWIFPTLQDLAAWIIERKELK